MDQSFELLQTLANLQLGFGVALTLQNILYCFMGVLLGTMIGVLPGLGPTSTIALLLPLTVTASPIASLIMLAGIFYGAQYGGSTTAILMNLPGETSSAVTAIDGYQMARKGRAGPALAIAAIGSLIAGTIATFVIALTAPALTRVALSFQSPEYFSLIVFGFILSVALARGSLLKALAMVVVGILIGTIGTDLYTGSTRLTLGTRALSDGIDFVSLSVGLFGIAEILRNQESGQGRGVLNGRIGKLMPSRSDLRASAWPIARGTVIGSLLGVLPGGGALLASFASYSAEKRLSRTPERFGHGAIEGVAGPESANNAAAQTSFIPMLTLGIPSNAVMALIIGAMIMQGIVPGPRVATQHPELFWGLICSMWIGNAMLLLLNLPLVGIWVQLLRIPYDALFPAIVIFSAIGVFTINGNPVDVFLISIFGIVGYVLLRLDFEIAPLLLGFVLGPLLEQYLRRSLIVSGGDPMVFLTSPLSASFLLLSVAVLVIVSMPAIRKRREVVFTE